MFTNHRVLDIFDYICTRNARCWARITKNDMERQHFIMNLGSTVRLFYQLPLLESNLRTRPCELWCEVNPYQKENSYLLSDYVVFLIENSFSYAFLPRSVICHRLFCDFAVKYSEKPYKERLSID